MQNFLKINENDNVVVALNTIPAGTAVSVKVQDSGAVDAVCGNNAAGGEAADGGKTVCEKVITALEEIPAGHKMAICDITAGGEVIKYGYRIGNAKEDIKAGTWIHTHNLKTALGDLLEYTYEPVQAVTGQAQANGQGSSQAQAGENGQDGTETTFMGFKRPDG